MAGFWAGFGTTLASNIEERTAEARQRAAKRQDYLQTYGTRAILEREQQANSALGTVNFLQSKGMTKDQLRYVMDKNGLQGITQLKAEISSRDDLSKEDVAKIIKVSEDYVANNPEEDMVSTVRRAYGLYKGGANPVEKDRNIFAAVLGYDSGAVEGEVLDDLYINGYTGRDIYRIMGSSPQTTGEALEYDMPTKPYSSTTYANTYSVLNDSFERMVESQIAILDSEFSTADPTRAKEIADQRKELLTIKGQGLGGVGDFENLGFDASPIYKLAEQQEELQPEVVSRNPNLGSFRTLYESYTTEDRTEPTVHSFDTKEERDAAIRAGVVKSDDLVSLNGSKPEPYTGPTFDGQTGPSLEDRFPGRYDREVSGGSTEASVVEAAAGIDPVIETAVSLLDGKDGRIESYETLYNSMMELPEDKRSEYAAMFMSLEEETSLMDIVSDMAQESPEAADYLTGKAFGGSVWALGAFSEGMGRAYQFITGDTEKAARLIMSGRDSREEAKEIMADGIVSYMEDLAEETGADGAWGPERGKMLKESLMQSPTFESNVMEAAFTPLNRESGGLKDVEDMRKEYRTVSTVKPDVDFDDPTSVPDGKSLNRESGGSKDLEAMRKEYRTVGTVKPDVDFDDPTSVPDSSSRAFSDSPSALDAAPESRVSAVVGTGADRRPKNAGMMSRPEQPKTPDSEAKPEMQDTLSDMVDKGIRVHGASSQTAKLLKKVSDQATRGEKVKVSDITKLMRDTAKLPKTDTRDTLLMQLYELRDTLNNR